MFRKCENDEKSNVPKISEKNWKKLCDYQRQTNQNCDKNFKNFVKIKLDKWFILKPKTRHFFAIYSSNKTSDIAHSKSSKTKETDIVESEFLKIHPGHYCNKADLTAQEFFEDTCPPDRLNYWSFLCGKIHFKIVCFLTIFSSVIIYFWSVL